jgi:predicted  nucleic acid-binding Zn-ribbon protein
MNLKEEIIKIVQLQEIDSHRYTLCQEKDVKKPAQLEILTGEFEQKKQSLSAFEEKIKAAQLKKKEKELELASKEEGLRKFQGQLYQLKTNKEYQAKLSEIASLKADISIVEDGLLKILEEIEAAKKEFDIQKASLDQEEKKFKEQENKIQNEIRDMDIQIKNLEDKRKSFIGAVDQNILAKYEKLLKTRQSLAIVPVNNSNCGYCHMRVTHQKINEIKMYKDLAFCENCVRMLYIPEDVNP